MWSFIIVLMEPLIKVFLKFLYRSIELLPERFTEELIQDGPVKPLHEPIGSGPCRLRSPMLDVIELQKDLTRMDHRPPAVFPAVVREDVLNLQPLSLVERRNPVVKSIRRGLRKFGRIELPEGKRSVRIHNGLEVNPSNALQGTNHEGVLAKQISRIGALHMTLTKTGIGLLQKRDCKIICVNGIFLISIIPFI